MPLYNPSIKNVKQDESISILKNIQLENYSPDPTVIIPEHPKYKKGDPRKRKTDFKKRIKEALKRSFKHSRIAMQSFSIKEFIHKQP